MKQFKQGDQTTTTMSKEQTEMTFHEMFTNLFNTDFLTPDEIETICKAVELYSTAKEKAAFEAAREIEMIAGATAEAERAEKLVEALEIAKIQLEYLNQKFPETGTTNQVLSKIKQALTDYEGINK